MGDLHQAFVRALSLLHLDGFVTPNRGRGRPAHDRACVARAFLAKAVFNIPHTRALLDRLAACPTKRRSRLFSGGKMGVARTIRFPIHVYRISASCLIGSQWKSPFVYR